MVGLGVRGWMQTGAPVSAAASNIGQYLRSSRYSPRPWELMMMPFSPSSRRARRISLIAPGTS
jgi:hypothetical protein